MSTFQNSFDYSDIEIEAMHAGHVRNSLFILITLLPFQVFSQEIEVRGGFLQDSLIIGERIDFWITAKYPPKMEMIFPDSNTNFGAFEWANTAYFNSKLVGSSAFDSTVYTLQSFEIDAVQYLALEAIVLSGSDTIPFKIPLDSIYLAELAPVVTDTTSLKKNLDYQAVGLEFNYPLFYYIVGGLLVLALILLAVFWKRIIKYFKLRKLVKGYRFFSKILDEYVRELKKEPSPELAERALSHWKKYQQELDKVSFTKLTTKEILGLTFTSELESPLKSIDRAVYGKRPEKTLYQEFQLIENFAQERYQKRIDSIKYGK